ncbi:MAG TPA: cytochrome c [Paenalcaligenes sp.]|nr:cytochrome c [Paenalcaligenes sp.]
MVVKRFFGLVVASTLVMAAPQALAVDEAVLEQGKMLFTTEAKPMHCAICHALEDAGATGSIGPSLDDLKPTKEQIHKVMIEGMGAMPSFEATLSEEERDAIAEYVVHAVGQ